MVAKLPKWSLKTAQAYGGTHQRLRATAEEYRKRANRTKVPRSATRLLSGRPYTRRDQTQPIQVITAKHRSKNPDLGTSVLEQTPPDVQSIQYIRGDNSAGYFYPRILEANNCDSIKLPRPPPIAQWFESLRLST
jgi:hypothetical protein